MSKHVVQQNETSLDVALINTGSVESIVRLCNHNGLTLDDDLDSNQQLELSGLEIIRQGVVDEIARLGILPATELIKEAEPKDGQSPTQPQGVGFWQIEQNFIVS